MLAIKKVFFKDLLDIRTKENNEPFISLNENGILCSSQEIIFGNELHNPLKIIVRIGVYDKLLKVNELLKEVNDDYEICVVYGYRSIDVQTKKFLEILKSKTNVYYEDSNDLYEEVHKSIAVPSVSGHPTGGAVDVLIYNKQINTFLDFGTFIYDFSIDGYNSILNKNLSKEAYNNRVLLNQIMIKAGFAPYYGEYWHFSYGDKEWAFYYGAENALYKQKMTSEITVIKNK